jgi:hypothetical protein
MSDHLLSKETGYARKEGRCRYNEESPERISGFIT